MSLTEYDVLAKVGNKILTAITAGADLKAGCVRHCIHKMAAEHAIVESAFEFVTGVTSPDNWTTPKDTILNNLVSGVDLVVISVLKFQLRQLRYGEFKSKDDLSKEINQITGIEKPLHMNLVFPWCEMSSSGTMKATYGLSDSSEVHSLSIPQRIVQIDDGSDAGWTLFTEATLKAKGVSYDTSCMMSHGFKFVTATPFGDHSAVFAGRPPQYFGSTIHSGFENRSIEVKGLNRVKRFFSMGSNEQKCSNAIEEGIQDFIIKYSKKSEEKLRSQPRELIFSYAEAVCRCCITLLFPDVSKRKGDQLSEAVFMSEIPSNLQKKFSLPNDSLLNKNIIKVCIASLCSHKCSTIDESIYVRGSEVLDFSHPVFNFVIKCLGIHPINTNLLTMQISESNESDFRMSDFADVCEKNAATHTDTSTNTFYKIRDEDKLYEFISNRSPGGHSIAEVFPDVIPFCFSLVTRPDSRDYRLPGCTAICDYNEKVEFPKEINETLVICIQQILSSWGCEHNKMFVLPGRDNHMVSFPDFPINKNRVPKMIQAIQDTLTTQGIASESFFDKRYEPVIKEATSLMPYHEVRGFTGSTHFAFWSHIFVILPGDDFVEAPSGVELLRETSRRRYFDITLDGEFPSFVDRIENSTP